MSDAVHGAASSHIQRVLSNRTPLAGLDGFAGQLSDGRLVRDTLGREPLFVDGDSWAFDRRHLEAPTPFPAGAVGRPDEDPREVLEVPTSAVSSERHALSALDKALTTVLDGVPSSAPVGFSGGIDSALLATATTGPCYVVGFSDGPDLESARQAARRMNRDLTVINIDMQDLESAISPVVAVTGITNPIDVAIGAALYTLGERLRADGHDRLVLGQGADELFAGYEKVANAPTDERVTATSVRAARDEQIHSLPFQCLRDVCVLRAAGVEPVTPYLSDRMVRTALTLPESLLVADGMRKRGLRVVADDRLPSPIVERDKRALQYGSRVSRELDRLARQNGFKRRMDNHVRQYIENIADVKPSETGSHDSEPIS